MNWVYAQSQSPRIRRAFVRYYERIYDKGYSGWKNFEGTIPRIKQMCRDADAEFMAFIFPLLSDDLRPGRYPFVFAHEAIRGVFQAHDLICLDLVKAFSGLSPVRLQAVPDLDPYPSEISHRIAAESIFRFLLENSLVDAAYEPRLQRPSYTRKLVQRLEWGRVIDYHAYPYVFSSNQTACVIGTSGGHDSWKALLFGGRYVVGVEMDPEVARMVTEEYTDYAGHLFRDGTYSELVVDEGRSYLRRTDRKFDVIQQVNNFTPIAFQNGALNLSESYLLTVESFKDFYDHLTDDGIISISRWGSIRLLAIAVEMFRRMGLPPGEYARHIVVCEGPDISIPTCMIKKSPFTPEEIERFRRFLEAGKPGNAKGILYAPYQYAKGSEPTNLYYKIATSDHPERYWNIGCFTVAPPTDNRPFFDHFHRLGAEDKQRKEIALLPDELREIIPRGCGRPAYSQGRFAADYYLV